jgi:hypothetical protein
VTVGVALSVLASELSITASLWIIDAFPQIFPTFTVSAFPTTPEQFDFGMDRGALRETSGEPRETNRTANLKTDAA